MYVYIYIYIYIYICVYAHAHAQDSLQNMSFRTNLYSMITCRTVLGRNMGVHITCVYMYIYIYICIRAHTYIHVYIYIYIHTHIQIPPPEARLAGPAARSAPRESILAWLSRPFQPFSVSRFTVLVLLCFLPSVLPFYPAQRF